MDLKDFIPTEDNLVVELKIKDKPLLNKDGSPMTITVMSPHSKEYKAVIYKASNERLKNKDFGIEDLEKFELNALVETTVDWDITWDDKKLKEFDPKLAHEIYSKASWIILLIKEARADTSDFTIP